MTRPMPIDAVIQQGATFRGTLAFESGLRIDGKVNGKIVGPGTLVLGESAEVDAEIEVGDLLILGATLRGQAEVARSVEVAAGSDLYADIRCEYAYIDDAALVAGEITLRASPTADANDA